MSENAKDAYVLIIDGDQHNNENKAFVFDTENELKNVMKNIYKQDSNTCMCVILDKLYKTDINKKDCKCNVYDYIYNEIKLEYNQIFTGKIPSISEEETRSSHITRCKKNIPKYACIRQATKEKELIEDSEKIIKIYTNKEEIFQEKIQVLRANFNKAFETVQNAWTSNEELFCCDLETIKDADPAWNIEEIYIEIQKYKSSDDLELTQ